MLSRQRTTKALIRLRECAAWSAPLLFTYDINRFPHDVAHYDVAVYDIKASLTVYKQLYSGRFDDIASELSFVKKKSWTLFKFRCIVCNSEKSVIVMIAKL